MAPLQDSGLQQAFSLGDIVRAAASDHGGHRSSGSTSGEAILAAFIPTFTTAVIYLAIFAAIRNWYPKHYAPRTFLGTVPEKDRTPSSRQKGTAWFQDFRGLPDHFVLQHSSLDAYLYLRFLKFIIAICFVGSCITWPILFPINATGGGNASQLDKITIGNVAKNNKSHLWAHLVVAWVFFGIVFLAIARERLLLIGTRQACLLDKSYSSRLSAKTVLFMNAPRGACLPENLQSYFGKEAERSWPVKDLGDLEDLVQERNDTAYKLERAQVDLIINAVKQRKRKGQANGVERPAQRQPALVGSKHDAIELNRNSVTEIVERIDAHRSAPSRNVPEQSAVFVAFTNQSAAHRAYETISFKQPQIPIEDRYLGVQPKEALWKNLALPISQRLSKASLALIFVIVFIIFFSIPVGLIGTLSNVKKLAEDVEWLSWINNLPSAVVGLISGLLPPFLVSWFVSYVPKLFRHIAKLSGEPTTPQAELKTQAWFFAFQVAQVFLVTTLSSGGASVAAQIIKDPKSAPDLLAEGLPTASNFYLTYFILQGTASVASSILNYSDLLEYLFYEHYWDVTPREKFQDYAQMKGISYGSLMPKFTNFLVIAIAYSCIAPLVLGFATVGIFFYYISYRYNFMYVCQSKMDLKGEGYKRALQQMMTGVYLAELSLIGLFGVHSATAQATLMVVLLVLTAVLNLILDRTLRPLELYLGVDTLQEQEVPFLAHQDHVDEADEEALHISSHNRRLGLMRLGGSTASMLSELFDAYISAARSQTKAWLHDPSAREEEAAALSAEDLAKAYTAPALLSKTPKLWIPRDSLGVSKEQIEQNKAAGITTTDEGAEIDDKGNAQFDHDFEKVPIFSKPKRM